MTPKQMHLVSDQISFNKRTTFPVGRSAHGLGGSRHYSRPVTRSLLSSDDATRRRCRLGTAHRVPPNPRRSVCVVPASRRARVTSLDASVRTERVMSSHPSRRWRTAELRASVRSLALARNCMESADRGPPPAFLFHN